MATIFQAIGSIYAFLISQLGEVVDVIVANPILYIPVYLSLFGTVAFFAVKIIRRLGVRGRR